MLEALSSAGRSEQAETVAAHLPTAEKLASRIIKAGILDVGTIETAIEDAGTPLS